jgi:VanZ family protein
LPFSQRSAVVARPGKPLWIEYWLPAVIWLATVAIFSSKALGAESTGSLLAQILRWLHVQLDPAQFRTLHFCIRKCAHFTAYGVLSALFFRAFRATDPAPKIWKARYALLALAICAVTASADEFHQLFTPGRTGHWQDVVLDLIGASFVQCAILYGSYTRWATNRWSRRVNSGNASSSSAATVASPAER